MPFWVEYALAILAVILATSASMLLMPQAGLPLPYVTYFVLNALVIGYLRQGPAVVAIVLSAIAADYFFLPPEKTLSSAPMQYLIGAIFMLGNLVGLRVAQVMRGNAMVVWQRAALQEALNEVFHQALSCANEEQLGRLCLAKAEKVTGSKMGFMAEINPNTGLLDDIAISDLGWQACRMQTGTSHGKKLPGSLAVHGLYGRVLKDGKGFFDNTPESHPDRIGIPAGHPPLTAFLGVPLLSGGKTLGLIAVANRDGGYGPHDLEALESLASAFTQVLMRHRAEAGLKKVHEQLEQRIQERTDQLLKAVEELRAERQRFHDVLNALPVYVVLLTPDYHVSFANRVFLDRFGSSSGRRCYEHLFGRTEPCEICETYKVLQTNAPRQWEWTGPDQNIYNVFDFPFNEADGKQVILEMGIDVTQKKQIEGELENYRQNLEDLVRRRTRELEISNQQLLAEVSERKQAEEALRQSEDRLKATFHQAGVGLMETSTNDELIAVNEQVCKILGYRREELLGKRIEELTYSGDRALSNQLNTELHQGLRQRLDYEKRYLKADGIALWVHVTAAPVRDAQGRWLRSIVTVEDISERKEMIEALTKAKEDLRHYSENLERQVEERTAKLQHALGELEHFSYTLSHDMRAPLRAIQGFGAIMMESGCETCKNAMSKNLLDRMVTGASRMDRMITDALEYSRSARDVLQLASVDLAELLTNMLQTQPNIQPLFADVAIEGQLPEVLGNETALNQCFSNLLSNAVKYVSHGVKPRVRIRAEERDADYVRIWVEDNGIGISKEHQPRLFQMFQRVSSKYEGTGIGLALVKKNVERMGGRVGVESESGQGSRFWLELKQAGMPNHSMDF